MKLIQVHNEKRTEIDVRDVIYSPDHINLVLEGVYSRGHGISHVLVADDGTETSIELKTDCPVQLPYIAIGEPY